MRGMDMEYSGYQAHLADKMMDPNDPHKYTRRAIEVGLEFDVVRKGAKMCGVDPTQSDYFQEYVDYIEQCIPLEGRIASFAKECMSMMRTGGSDPFKYVRDIVDYWKQLKPKGNKYVEEIIQYWEQLLPPSERTNKKKGAVMDGIVKELVAFSTKLDASGLSVEADVVDKVIRKLSIDKKDLMDFMKKLEEDASDKAQAMLAYLKREYKHVLAPPAL